MLGPRMVIGLERLGEFAIWSQDGHVLDVLVNLHIVGLRIVIFGIQEFAHFFLRNVICWHVSRNLHTFGLRNVISNIGNFFIQQKLFYQSPPP